MKEWTFSVSEIDRGTLSLSIYEITEGKPNHERETIRLELSLQEMINVQEAVNRCLAFHLRVMA